MKLASALVPVSRRPKRFLITSLGPRGPTDLAPSLATPEGLAQWLPGFHRAVPSTPLDASGYVLGRTIAKRPGHMKCPGRFSYARLVMAGIGVRRRRGKGSDRSAGRRRHRTRL